MDKLQNQIMQNLREVLCDSMDTFYRFNTRLSQGALSIDENPESHFCVFFLPYNPVNKEVFLVHHKKADKWLFPGGHIDEGEGLFETLNREIREELGAVNFFSAPPLPFLFTTTDIKNDRQTCREHFDTWYLMETDGASFEVDLEEFYETKWLTVDEALKIVTDKTTRKALEYLKN